MHSSLTDHALQVSTPLNDLILAVTNISVQGAEFLGRETGKSSSSLLLYHIWKHVSPIRRDRRSRPQVWRGLQTPYRIMTRSINDVHRGHILIQEVAPDGNGIAATAIILLNGDARCIAGTWGTETATSAEEKKWERFEERGTWKRLTFRVECLEMRERKGDPARHTGLILTEMVSFSCWSSCTKQHTNHVSASKRGTGLKCSFLSGHQGELQCNQSPRNHSMVGLGSLLREYCA